MLSLNHRRVKGNLLRDPAQSIFRDKFHMSPPRHDVNIGLGTACSRMSRTNGGILKRLIPMVASRGGPLKAALFPTAAGLLRHSAPVHGGQGEGLGRGKQLVGKPTSRSVDGRLLRAQPRRGPCGDRPGAFRTRDQRIRWVYLGLKHAAIYLQTSNSHVPCMQT